MVPAEEWVGVASELVPSVVPTVGTSRITDRIRGHLFSLLAITTHFAIPCRGLPGVMTIDYSLVGLLENGCFLEMSNCSSPYSVRAFVVENVGDGAKNFTTGEKISSKSTPYSCQNPFATNLALYFGLVELDVSFSR